MPTSPPKLSQLIGRYRLMAVLGGLLVLGFLATSLASYFASRDEIRTAILERELPLTADTVYSEIQKDLVRPVFISSMMASDTFLRDWVMHGEKDVNQITKYLDEVRRRYGAFTSFFVSEASGRYYHFSGLKRNVRDNPAADSWYFRVSQMKDPYEINVDVDQADQNSLTIFINYRVLDYKSNYLGATGVGLNVDAVQHLLADYQQRYQRNVYFVSPKGNVVLFGHRPNHGRDRIQDVPGLQALAEKILSTPSGSYQYIQDGRTHLLNVRYLPELRWYLFVEKGEDEATAGIRETLYINLGICALVSLIILALTGMTLSRYQQRLETMATQDKLSGLYNRQAFELLLHQAIAESRRHPMPLSLVLFDIDHFKRVNDQFGHSAGDQAIQGIARFIRQRLRSSDAACRWGGEEFILLLKDCSKAEALVLANQLRETIAATPFALRQHTTTLTLSGGIASLRPDDSAETLIDRADLRLYGAKAAGRNRVVINDHDTPRQEGATQP